MNTYKVLVLGEMIILIAGTIANHSADAGFAPTLVSKPVLQKAIAITSLMALLMFLVEIGFGAAAAMFGALIVLGYLMRFGEQFGKALVALQARVYAP